jgi:BirA family biotin operon repressor/biotin-[acetyl-CoA-carboxylase] ligase
MASSIPLTSVLKPIGSRVIGRSVVYYPSLSSTNDTAKKLAQQGAAEGTVVLAGQQTEGRGRLGRSWVSAPGSSVLLSVILHPDPSRLAQINMAAGLAIVRTIEKATKLGPAIKWPNDVLINGRKVCGILMENLFEGGQLKGAIVGIGLNVRLDTSSYSQISDIATSLAQESGMELTPRDILPTLLRELDQAYCVLQQGGDIYGDWLGHVETLGRFARVRCGDSIEEGYAESIGTDGSITLRRADGSLATILTGE